MITDHEERCRRESKVQCRWPGLGLGQSWDNECNQHHGQRQRQEQRQQQEQKSGTAAGAGAEAEVGAAVPCPEEALRVKEGKVPLGELRCGILRTGWGWHVC